ncbi:MAG: hypothetical protein ACUVUU_04640 [bacterium]
MKSESDKWREAAQVNKRKSLWTLIAQLALLLSLLVPAGASSDKKGSQPKRMPIQRSILQTAREIHSLIDYLQTPSNKSPSQQVDSLKVNWRRIASIIESDTTLPNSGIGQVIQKQTQGISDFLRCSTVESTIDLEETKEELNVALETLSGLMRMAEATNDSIPTALLVVSSIACECETERCISMLSLYDSLFFSNREDSQRDDNTDPKQANSQDLPTTVPQTATRLNSKSRIAENHLVAILDFVQAQGIEDVVGILEIPYWLLFDRQGNVAMIIGGDTNPIDVAETLTSWLGEGLDSRLEKGRESSEADIYREGIFPETKGIREGGLEDGRR